MKKSAQLLSILILALTACVEVERDDGSGEHFLDLFPERLEGELWTWPEGSAAGVWTGDVRNSEITHFQADGKNRFRSSISIESVKVSVCYPYCPEAELSGQLMDIPFPSVLEAEEPGELPLSLPVAGFSKDGRMVDMYFLTGILEIPVIGGGAVKEVTAVPAGKNGCSGRLMADFSYGKPPIVRIAPGGGPLTLSYSGGTGASLSDTVKLRIPLPPGTYEGLEIVMDAGWDESTSVKLEQPVVIERAVTTRCGAVRLQKPSVLKSFRFDASLNRNLRGDVEFIIDPEDGTVHSKIEYYAGLKSMIPSFELSEGATAYVNGTKQISGVSKQNFYRPIDYTIVDSRGLETTFTVSVEHFTGLPVLIIDTPGAHPVDSKEVWIENTLVHLDGVGLYSDYDTAPDDPDFIKGRGNATWKRFEKKGMNLKLGKKASLLGMPAHKRWCLMANYRDRIKIRNDLAFYMANGMEAMGWNPHGEFVELILNGEHRGMYEVVEQIGIDPGRLDLTEFETDDGDNFLNINEETITGGYIFMIDAYYDEEYKFKSQYLKSPVEFKDPNDNITPEMMAYAKDYFARFEKALQAYDFKTVYELIDMDSFIDFWLLNDLFENDDAANQHSVFVHKDRGGKLFAGPVWDFDSFTWRSTGEHFNMRKKIWYPYLLQDKAFCRRAVERWNQYRDFILTIPDYAAMRCAQIEKSEAYDAALWWPIVGNTSTFGDEALSFRAALERMQTNFAGRFANMEKYLGTIVASARYDSHADGK